MPKRAREAVLPRIELHQISDDISLKVRYADVGVDGSVLMFYKSDILECTHYKEARDVHYTEPNWLERYKKAYDVAEDKTDEELVKENDDASLFSNKMSTIPLSSGALAGRGGARFALVSFDGEVLKLKMEWDVDASKHAIGHTQHTSVQCKFDAIAPPMIERCGSGL